LAEKDDAVAKEAGFAHVVRHHHDGFVQRLKNLPQVFLQVEPHEWIERTHRLIEQNHARVEHESPHDAQPLPLTARKLRRIAVQGLAGQPR
jgi:hypothetical protein